MKEEKDVVPIVEKKKTRFPISKIKRIILQDEEIGKTSHSVPVVLSKAVEMFIQELTEKAVKKLSIGDSRITVKNIEDAIEENEKFHFLRSVVKKYKE